MVNISPGKIVLVKSLSINAASKVNIINMPHNTTTANAANLLMFFFIYSSILRSTRKSYDWQCTINHITIA